LNSILKQLFERMVLLGVETGVFNNFLWNNRYSNNHGKHRPRRQLRSKRSVNAKINKGVALPFTLKSISRQKKNYGNSNISTCKNIIFKKSS